MARAVKSNGKNLSNLNNPYDFHGCPYFGLIGDPSAKTLFRIGDPGTKTLFRTQDGSCHATAKPTLLDLEYQDEFCLNARHNNCPVYVQFTESHKPPNLTLRKGFWVPTKAAAFAPNRGVRIFAAVLLLFLLAIAGFWLINQNDKTQAFAQAAPTNTPVPSSTPDRPQLTEVAAVIINLSPTHTLTPTVTLTASATATPSSTATPQETATVTASPTSSPTQTATAVATQTATATSTPSATPTSTPTQTATATATAVLATQPPPAPTSPPMPTATAIGPPPTSGPPPPTATKISLNP